MKKSEYILLATLTFGLACFLFSWSFILSHGVYRYCIAPMVLVTGWAWISTVYLEIKRRARK